MKLSRNRIRKIRKQQHQSVRKWKKHHKSSARRTTFRQSRSRCRRSGSVKYTPKIVNRTLKRYVSDIELQELKEKYRKLRRDKRNKRRKYHDMVGGAKLELIKAAATAAATAAAIAVVTASIDQKQGSSSSLSETGKSPPSSSASAPSVTGKSSSSSPSSPSSPSLSPDTKQENGKSAPQSKDGKKQKNQPFQLGPEIEGDITIGTEEQECKDEKDVSKLVKFLIQKGLPYYIQIQLKAGDKALNKNDTNIFDLRRVLYGKFTQDIKKITEYKRDLYLKINDVVGIANSELYGSSDPGVFIYTGEKGQILNGSNDKTINIRLLQDDPNAAPIPPLTDSKRLYKIMGDKSDVKPASIDSVDRTLKKLDREGKIDMSEFRLQVAPMTPEELNKDARQVAAGNTNSDTKVVVDESNTYVVNLNVGCKVISVQTLKKSLEKIRSSLENKKDATKKSALDVIRMLISKLEDPNFAKSDGYDDFRENVFEFSYKISGSERLYGISQILTFFDDKKGDIPRPVTDEFNKLLNLLGHGTGGPNSDCLQYEVPVSQYVLTRLKVFKEKGKTITEVIEKPDNNENMSGFGEQLSKIGEVGSSKNTEEEEEDKTQKKEATNDATNEETSAKPSGNAGEGEGEGDSESSDLTQDNTSSKEKATQQDEDYKIIVEAAAAAGAAAAAAAIQQQQQQQQQQVASSK